MAVAAVLNQFLKLELQDSQSMANLIKARALNGRCHAGSREQPQYGGVFSAKIIISPVHNTCFTSLVKLSDPTSSDDRFRLAFVPRG
ncbi:uncharacterized protein NFIA_044760 [Aspergillus fischeri NRRL 181]|uniref:Uncharacterized protein n=1 Tax=Neosartorya fischeri (strain ATCC 1020 / DSM 3700 / CBS 544.65 / FGSC A1164 / JCM 1740 / NRRL 181 / WB 181) TaxID=331117 RepID=A1CV80_NEOFI|nr:uncharacterized protein NFIA_044760 [Aspergillus fischeri NRRL 181]EAW25657.1 hypothetical protein NFIA_044760 [Aspergillus fischeri NRRL 181]